MEPEAAFRGPAKAVLAALLAERGDGPLRLAVLADIDGKPDTARK